MVQLPLSQILHDAQKVITLLRCREKGGHVQRRSSVDLLAVLERRRALRAKGFCGLWCGDENAFDAEVKRHLLPLTALILLLHKVSVVKPKDAQNCGSVLIISFIARKGIIASL